MTNARSIRALVVDDEPLAREMIREMLAEDSDVEIVALQNASAAVRQRGIRAGNSAAWRM